MNLFDITVIIITGYCLIRGVFRGLIKELSSIVGVLGGFYAAYTYYGDLGKLLSRWISDVTYLNILSFAIIFVGIFLIISILGVIIKYVLNISFLGWFDRICGALFGLIKGGLIVCVIFILLTAFLPKGAPIIRDSMLSPYVSQVSEKMVKVVSNNMKRDFSAKIKELKKLWKNHE
ncbi:MAG: CvpA family protein [Deltaproteobacteria bacterium]|nr:MAG: CvpA family protein [Deltaproteobacteria bacterium]